MLRGLEQSYADGSGCTGGRRSPLPALRKLHCSWTEMTRVLSLPGEVTPRVWAGAGERAHAKSAFLFSSPPLFCSAQPGRRGFQQAAGAGAARSAQRQRPTGCVTAVTLFRSDKRRWRMTWGWCSPAPGLIGPSSGLNAKVSWQREAEEPDFPVPAARAGERQSLRSEERRTGPPAPGTPSAVPAHTPFPALESG